MSKVTEIAQQYVNKSTADKISHAKQAYNEIVNFTYNNGISADATAAFLIDLFKLFTSGDKKTRDGEYELYRAVFNVNCTQDQFFEITNYGADPKFVAEMDNLIDSMPPKVKAAICIFGICILTVDRELSSSEITLLERIYG